MFRILESEDTLDPLNDIDLFYLHHIFIPQINENLMSFTCGWNNHQISTENGQTPMQLHLQKSERGSSRVDPAGTEDC